MHISLRCWAGVCWVDVAVALSRRCRVAVSIGLLDYCFFALSCVVACALAEYSFAVWCVVFVSNNPRVFWVGAQAVAWREAGTVIGVAVKCCCTEDRTSHGGHSGTSRPSGKAGGVAGNYHGTLFCALVVSSAYVWIACHKLLELHVKRGHHCVALSLVVLLLPHPIVCITGLCVSGDFVSRGAYIEYNRLERAGQTYVWQHNTSSVIPIQFARVCDVRLQKLNLTNGALKKDIQVSVTSTFLASQCRSGNG